MTGPELHTPDGLPETPRARVIRSIGDSTELDACYLAALLYVGDQLGGIARAVERLHPGEETA